MTNKIKQINKVNVLLQQLVVVVCLFFWLFGTMSFWLSLAIIIVGALTIEILTQTIVAFMLD